MLTLVARAPKNERIALSGERVVVEGAVFVRGEHGWVIEAQGAVATGRAALEKGKSRLLCEGVVVRLGELEFDCVEDLSVDGKNTVELAMGLARAASKRPSLETWSVIVLDGPERGTFAEVGDVLTIGRGAENGISITDTTVSREHLEVRVREGRAQVRDVGSTRGSTLGEHRLEPKRWAVWPRELVVRCGDVALGVVPPALALIEERAESIVESAPTPPPEEPKPLESEPSAAAEVAAAAPVVMAPAARAPRRAKVPASSFLLWAFVILLVSFVAAALVWIFWSS